VDRRNKVREIRGVCEALGLTDVVRPVIMDSTQAVVPKEAARKLQVRREKGRSGGILRVWGGSALVLGVCVSVKVAYHTERAYERV
jgi:hypothetical protein